MDETLPTTTGGMPWRAVAIVTGISAVLALALDAALAWNLAVPEVTATEADLLADADAVAPEPATRRALGEREYLSGILDRNLFDPEAIGVESEDAEGGGGGVAGLTIRLRGTVVSDPPIYSSAFIESEGKTVVHAYGIGQVVEGAEIVAIERFRVRIRRGETEDWLEVGGDKVTPERTTAGEGEASTEGGVTQESETKFTVSRSMLDEKLGNLADLQKEARALQHRGPDGEFDGYRLSAIRRGSMLDSIGVKNGDIIHSVNGLELSTMDGAMRALEQLRSETQLKVEVTRRGEPVALDYEIR